MLSTSAGRLASMTFGTPGMHPDPHRPRTNLEHPSKLGYGAKRNPFLHMEAAGCQVRQTPYDIRPTALTVEPCKHDAVLIMKDQRTG